MLHPKAVGASDAANVGASSHAQAATAVAAATVTTVLAHEGAGQEGDALQSLKAQIQKRR